MGLLAYAVDREEPVTLTLGEFSVQVKHVTDKDLADYLEGRLPVVVPDPDDAEQTRADLAKRKRVAEKLTAQFIAEKAVVGWEDPDIPYSREKAVELFTDPAFARVVQLIANKALDASNFALDREAALKRFAPESLEASSGGETNG